jgi:hypothetical protein
MVVVGDGSECMCGFDQTGDILSNTTDPRAKRTAPKARL